MLVTRVTSNPLALRESLSHKRVYVSHTIRRAPGPNGLGGLIELPMSINTIQDTRVLDALGDDTAREMLSRLEQPHTADDLAEACSVSTSTAYRKLELLSEAGLVDGTVRVRADRCQETLYRRVFDGLKVVPDGDGFAVRADRTDDVTRPVGFSD